MGIGLASPAPIEEFSDIDPPFAHLGLVDEYMRDMESFAQLALRQGGVFAQTPENPRDTTVAASMLGFGHAATMRQKVLVTVSLTSYRGLLMG
jgi:hypothetical protein